MSCERYWREGIDLAERGEPDPHRETCEVCRREHGAREAMIQALPLVGEDVMGNPNWKALVWQAIDRGQVKRGNGMWFFASAFVGTLALLLIWLLPQATPALELAQRIEVIPSAEPTRSLSLDHSSPNLGDHLHIKVNAGEEARIYHGDEAVVRCSAALTGRGCISDGQGLIADVHLITPGRYYIVTIQPGPSQAIPEPSGSRDNDLKAIHDAGARSQHIELTIQ